MTSAHRLVIAGMGPGNVDLQTMEVRDALNWATDFVGYKTYTDRLSLAPGQQFHASDNRVELDRAKHALTMAAEGRQVVVVSSGDPGVFAMASAVFEALEQGPAAWNSIDIVVLPGVTAMLAASARLGAPLGHDFCAINLSDNLKPWSLIEKRLRLAAEADFAMAFYNPRSASRPTGFARVLEILRESCGPDRLICFARAVSSADENLQVCSLAEASPEMADMRTMVIVGSSLTRQIVNGRYVYTPRMVSPESTA